MYELLCPRWIGDREARATNPKLMQKNGDGCGFSTSKLVLARGNIRKNNFYFFNSR